MSSTNRAAAGGARDRRHKRDLYETPGWVTRAILPHLDLTGEVWEPACGGGAIVRELLRAGVPASKLLASDIEPLLGGGIRQDFRTDRTAGLLAEVGIGPRLIITNPPFRVDEKGDGVAAFLSKALQFVPPGVGQVALYCRLAWWAEGLGRMELRRDVRSRGRVTYYTLPCRPSFNGKGSDSTAGGWLVVRRYYGQMRDSAVPADLLEELVDAPGLRAQWKSERQLLARRS